MKLNYFDLIRLLACIISILFIYTDIGTAPLNRVEDANARVINFVTNLESATNQ